MADLPGAGVQRQHLALLLSEPSRTDSTTNTSAPGEDVRCRHKEQSVDTFKRCNYCEGCMPTSLIKHQGEMKQEG
ncbi:hypothetical protein UY3_15344 [Chelonia mydas]|uniref:Uncharacterized protein n=1 Tax=Chelonia mydas TaxID=8469 RepID=M7AWX6_CHEMY|nr:hypothetical protein UY3_15344 [Chelonia mydas]